MNILVISPHPDDETLGAGGTILRYVDEGNNVFWLNVTNMMPEYGYEADIVKKRLGEIEKVKSALGIKKLFDLKLKPASLDTYPKSEIIQKMKPIFEEVKPEIVILPYMHDAHSDHKVVFDTAYACTKSFRAPYIKKILCMEVISETNYSNPEYEFKPNYYVDISDYIDKKTEIASIYSSEMSLPPFPRSIDAIRSLSVYRGSSCSKCAAESFMLIKEIA